MSQDISCSCSKCARLCEGNPGWMTPDEAIKAIKAGFAHKLMRDWLEPYSKLNNNKKIYVLAPASVGCEGTNAPEMPAFDFFWTKGTCTFFRNKKCEIHTSGFKPIQCREALACRPNNPCSDNFDTAKLWDTKEGKAALRLWEKNL